MVKLELKEKGYLVRDFSSVYMNGGTGISLGATAGGKNKIAIFDQFERLFQEGVENQKNVFALIRKLSENGVVVLFSMREEALLPFLEVVDLNHLEHVGDSYACCRVGVQNCNKMAHGDHAKKASGRGNIIMIGSSRIKGEESAIRERCNDVFKEEGDGIYRIVKNHPVIEQQIMLNMRQNGDLPFEAKEAFARGDLTDVMKWYYDVQLCSTGDYFNASRIMYLMSMMRQKNEAFGTDMIMDALCVPLGHGEKHEEEMREYRSEEDKLKTCLEALAGMSLLRVKNTGSNRYYEVSHDYIAESFEVYANTELPSDVKAALDDYRSGHERRRKMDSLGRSRNQEQFQKARKKDGWVFAVWMIALLCTAIYYCMGMAAAVYSEIPLPFGTTPLPLPVLILADFSMFYIFSLYRNVAYYYGTAFPQNRNAGDGVRIGMVHLLYLVTMIFGVCTVLAGEHCLVFLGVGNIMNALTWLFIASDGRISSYGRKQYRLYGWKTVAVGVLLILFSKFLMLGNFREIRLGIIDIGEIGTVMQLIAMGALLLYGYVTHMNREFFYANLEPILNM